MGWLDKNKNAKQESRATSAKVPVVSKNDAKRNTMGTILGPGLEVVGQIKAEEDIFIAGKVDGEVTCGKKVTVAASGVVEGKINCHSVIVFGAVNGDIKASELVKIEQSGKVIGDIYTKTFTNQLGGFFEGYSHMAKHSPSKKETKTDKQTQEASKEKRKGS